MNGLFRRFTAFLLGMVFGIVALLGGTAFGAYWAYKNIRPLSYVDAPVGDMKDSTMQELIDLVARAAKSPDEYTFKRLEQEYGLDLKSLLNYGGISTDDTKDVDWDALQNVSFLSIASGTEAFLKSIKLRALYVFIPSATGMKMDEILSPEAQASLGEKTLWDLVTTAEGDEEVGLLTAVKGLKIGSLLPSVFDAKFDEKTEQFVYSVKKDSNLGILNLVSDVSLKTVIDIASGADVVEEIREGGLLCLGKKSVSEILDTVASITGEAMSDDIAKYTRAFENVRLKDLFTLDEGGKYEFSFDKLVSELEVGYLVGYEKDDNGEWKNADGNSPEGLLSVVVNLNIGEVLEGDGDVVKMIEAAAGDVSVETLFKTFMKEEDIPTIVKKLGNVTVSSVIGSGTDHIVDRLLESLGYSFNGVTLRDVLFDLLPDEAKDFITDNALLDGLMNLRLSDFIRDKEDYTLDTFVRAFEKAIGGVKLGEVIGIKQENGKWDCNEYLAILMDKELGEFLNLTRAENPQDVINDVFGDITFGDFFGAAFGYDNDNAAGIYMKGDETVTKGFDENLLDLKVADLIVSITGENQGDAFTKLKSLSFGDVCYSLSHAIPLFEEYVSYDGEKVYTDNELKNITELAFGVTVGGVIENFTDLEVWKERSKNIKLGDVLAIVINKFTPVKTNFDEEAGKWVVTSDELKDAIAAILNVELDDFYKGDWIGLARKSLGGLSVGDICRVFLPEEWEDHKFVAATYSVSVDGILDIFENEEGKRKALYEYSQKIYDGVVLGDIVEVFYKDWKNIGAIEAIGSVTVPDFVGMILGFKPVKEVFDGITVGDLVSDIVPDKFENNDFVETVYGIKIVDVIDNAVDFEKEKFYNYIYGVFGDMKISAAIDAFFEDWQEISAFDTLGDIKIIDCFSIPLGKKSVEAVFGEITLGGLVHNFIPDDLVSNKFVSATETLSVQTIIDCVANKDVKFIFSKLAAMYDGVRFADIFDIFGVGEPSDEGIAALYNADLGKIFDCVATGNGDYAAEVFENCIKNLGDTPTLILVGVTVVTGTILYFVANDALVNIVINIWGEDAVWYDVLGSALGYVRTVDNTYFNGYNKNILGEKFMGEKIAETLKKGYPFADEYKTLVTLGNLLAFTKEEAKYFEDLTQEKFVADESGNIYLSGRLENATKVILNYTLSDALDKKFDVFLQDLRNLSLGDVVSYFVERFAPASVGENKFVAATYAVTIQDIIDIAKGRKTKKEVVGYFDGIYEDVCVGDLVGIAYEDWSSIAPVSAFLKVGVSDYVALALGERAVDTVVGNISLGDLVSDFIPDDINENKFVSACYSFTVGGIIRYAADLGNDGGKDKAYTRAIEKFDGVVMGDLVSLFYKDWRDISPVNAFGSVSVGDYISIVAEKKSVQAVLGDITVLSLVDSFIKNDDFKDTALMQAVLGISFNDVIDCIDGETTRKDKMFEIFGELSLQDGIDSYNVLFDKNFNLVEKLPYGKDAAAKVLSVKINVFKDGFRNGVKETLKTISLGDVGASLVKKIADRLGVPQEYSIEDGKYVVTGGFDVLMNDYYNISLYEIYENKTNIGYVKGKIDKPFGAYLKDVMKIASDKFAFYEGSVDFDGTTYSATGTYSSLLNAMLNVTLKEFYDGLKESGMDYVFGERLFGNVLVGEVLDGGNNAFENGVWTDKDGNAIDFGTGTEATLRKTFYGISLEQILNGDVYSVITDEVKSTKVGKVLGYETNEAGDWMNGGVKVTGIVAMVSDYTVGELTDFNSIVDGWYIGDLMGYTRDESGIWKNGDTAVTGVIAKLSDKKIAEVKTPEDFNEFINGLTLTDVLGEETCNSNKILKILKNKEIKNLANGIDDISVGDVMGFAYTDGEWKDENGNAPTGIVEAIIDLKIGDMNDTEIKNRVNAMPVKKLINVTDTPLELISDDTTVLNAAQAVQERLKTATMSELDRYGIIDFDTEIDDGVTLENALDVICASEEWRTLTVNALFVEIVKKAYRNANP